MSSDEELRVRGRILTEYIEAKTTMVALEAEADKISNSLSGVASALNNKNFRGPEYAQSMADFPTPDQVRQLVSDINSTQKRLTAAAKQLKQLGVDINSEL
jgi:predicted  nucleic acid-binding Zn-ribbon protein